MNWWQQRTHWRRLSNATTSTWYQISPVISLTLLSLTLPAHAGLLDAYISETTPLAGKIWDTQQRRFTDLESVLEQTPDGSWLLLGETHENHDHHSLQTDIINLLASQNRLANVAFEMAHTEQQPLLDRAHSGEIEATPEALDWQTGWPWEWYKGPVTAAINKANRVIAADLPRDRKMQAYGDSSLSVPATQPYREFMLDLLFESHCGQMPKSQLGNMLRVQYSRDRSMIDAINRNRSQRGVNLLIAGTVHTRIDLGLPYWEPELNSKTLLMLAAAEDSDPASYYPPSYSEKPVADYIIFTPGFEYKSGCD